MFAPSQSIVFVRFHDALENTRHFLIRRATSKKTGRQNKKEHKESEEESKSAHTAYVKMSVKPYVCSSSTTSLAIVPVRVKAKAGSAFVEIYAFLDSGSNTSFCTETP